MVHVFQSIIELQFYTQKFCLSKPVSEFKSRGRLKPNIRPPAYPDTLSCVFKGGFGPHVISRVLEKAKSGFFIHQFKHTVKPV